MEEEWVRIREFPIYVVSNFGRVVNISKDLIVPPTPNAQGIAKVNLTYNRFNTSRSLAVLVADAFIPRDNPHFNSPINLNGDRMDCHVLNLLWRPRWFAIQYHKQFGTKEFNESRRHIENIVTKEEFVGWKEPCTKYGLRYIDILLSCVNGTPTMITRQRFRFLD